MIHFNAKIDDRNAYFRRQMQIEFAVRSITVKLNQINLLIHLCHLKTI
jgi:hypothetical protein